MADSQSRVTIVIQGQATNLTQALAQARTQLSGFGTAATEAGVKAKALGEGEAKAEVEARSLSRGVRIAAESVRFFGVESGESATKLFALSGAGRELASSLGGLRQAIIGGTVALGAFAAIDFLKEGVSEAMAGQAAFARLQATFKGNAEAFRQTKEELESGSAAWAKYGETVSDMAGLLAQAKGGGISAQTILGDPAAIADLGVALKTGVSGAIQALSAGPRAAMEIGRALNLSANQARVLRAELAGAQNNATARAQILLQAVEQSGFAGQGAAQADTAQGKFSAFNASMSNLKETLANGLLPALTDMAGALTSLVQGANSMLAGFGGLAGFLQATWKPLLGGAVVTLLAFKIGIGRIVDAVKGLFRPSVAEATADAVGLGDAIAHIPTAVDTVATFDNVGAMAAKDAYLDNMLLIPGAMLGKYGASTSSLITTPVFDKTTADANVANYEEELSKVPAHVQTQLSTLGTLGALTTSAVVTGVVVQSGALKGLNDAVGNMVGSITRIDDHAKVPTVGVKGQLLMQQGPLLPLTVGVKAAGPIDVKGHITGWTEATPTAPAGVKGKITGWTEPTATPPAPVKGKISGWTEPGATPPAAVKGKISSWAEPTATPPAGVKGTITSWTETPPVIKIKGTITAWSSAAPPHLHVTGTVDQLTLPANQTIHLSGNAKLTHITVPAGTLATINGKAVIGSVSVPKGTTVTISGNASINGVSIPHGKTLTVSGVTGTAEITSVKLKPGTSVSVSGGTATFNTIQAKTLHADVGTIGSALGSSPSNPFYVKTVGTSGGGGGTPPGTPPSGGGFDIWGTIESAVIFSLISGLLSRIPGGKIIDWLKGKGPKPPDIGPPSGGQGQYSDDQILKMLQDAQDAGANPKNVPQWAKDAFGPKFGGYLPPAGGTTASLPNPADAVAHFAADWARQLKTVDWLAPFKAYGALKPFVSGVTSALGGWFAQLKAADWGAGLKAAGAGLALTGAILGGIAAAIGGAFSSKQLAPGSASIALNVGGAIMNALEHGINLATKTWSLTNVGGAIINALKKGIEDAKQTLVNWVSGFFKGIFGGPYTGPIAADFKTGQQASGTPQGAKPGGTWRDVGPDQQRKGYEIWIYTPPGGSSGGNSNQNLASALASAVRSERGTTAEAFEKVLHNYGYQNLTAQKQETHHHGPVTIHAPIYINGAQHPQDVGRAVVSALAQMEEGIKQAKRRAS